MSHASVIVAVSRDEIIQHGSVKAAVEHQMDPFNENGEWFADGTRWDSWQIGGRFTGMFAPAGNIAQRSEIKHLEGRLAANAFLANRRWCERSRMGWWGMTTQTECEIKAKDKGDSYEGRCICRDDDTGAMIVSWDEGSKDRWRELFWPRFIRGLPDDTTLVCVDYHV